MCIFFLKKSLADFYTKASLKSTDFKVKKLDLTGKTGYLAVPDERGVIPYGRPMNQEEKKYWLALTSIGGLGGNALQALIDAFGEPRKVFSATFEALCSVPGIGKTIAKRIRDYRDWTRPERDLQYYRKAGIDILTRQDSLYPAPLSHIYDAPPLLFAKGSLQENEKCIAVVGSRMASTYGLFVTERLCRELALHGMTVVSGMARGIDSAAHRGAISGKGRTIAVLGNGLDTVYPPENLSLSRSIAAHGALVTEYPVGTPPRRDHFPARNRIISGMALGVVVVEASERSGSLITARFALEQGREVFAVPGTIDSPGSKGTHKLLRDGAKLVETVNDIFDEIHPHLDGAQPSSPNCVEAEKDVNDGQVPRNRRVELTPDEKAVLSRLKDSPIDVDELIFLSGVPCQAIQPILTMLEMKGCIRKMPGSKYMLKE